MCVGDNWVAILSEMIQRNNLQETEKQYTLYFSSFKQIHIFAYFFN